MKAILPYDYNYSKLDTEYRYLFGIDTRLDPDAEWKYNGEGIDYYGKPIKIYKANIEKNREENCIALFSKVELRIFENKTKQFSFSGCDLSEKNLQKVFQIIERYYINNPRIDSNYSYNINRRYWHNPGLSNYKGIPLVSGAEFHDFTKLNGKEIVIMIRIPGDNNPEILSSEKINQVLIFDTETSGLHPTFNSILQLSYQIVEFKTWRVIKSVNHFFQWPEDESRVDWEAIYVNNLTYKFLQSQKLSDQKVALQEFFQDLSECQLAIAHNADFDQLFIDSAKKEFKVKTKVKWPFLIDTMKDTTELCRLSPRKYDEEWKWPKLIELASKLKIESSDISLHDSRYDVELTKRCFIELINNKFYIFRYE